MITINRLKGKLIINPNQIPNNGIVYLYAEWSMKSVMNLSLLYRVIEKYEINLYVYDIDEKYNEFAEKYSIKCHGIGETFWLHEGKIIHEIIGYENSEGEKRIRLFTENLISYRKK